MQTDGAASPTRRSPRVPGSGEPDRPYEPGAARASATPSAFEVPGPGRWTGVLSPSPSTAEEPQTPGVSQAAPPYEDEDRAGSASETAPGSTAGVHRVLPMGAGLVLTGLGLAFIGWRMRRA